MCKCTANKRTPFCGAPGCEWPSPDGMTVPAATKQPSGIKCSWCGGDVKDEADQEAASKRMVEPAIDTGDILRRLQNGLGRGVLTPFGLAVVEAMYRMDQLESDLRRLWHFAGCPFDHCQTCIDDAGWIKSLEYRFGPPSAKSVQAQHDGK